MVLPVTPKTPDTGDPSLGSVAKVVVEDTENSPTLYCSCAGYLRHLSLIHLPGIYVWSILLGKTGSAAGVNWAHSSL